MIESGEVAVRPSASVVPTALRQSRAVKQTEPWSVRWSTLKGSRRCLECVGGCGCCGGDPVERGHDVFDSVVWWGSRLIGIYRE